MAMRQINLFILELKLNMHKKSTKIKNHCCQLLFFIILFTTELKASDNNSTCETLLQNWLGDPSSLPELTYTDSGKFLNDLGDYNNCLFNDGKYTYLTMMVFNKLVAGYQFMGLCCPNECRNQIVSNKYSSIIQDYLNQQYQQKTNTTSLLFANLNFYDPVSQKPHLDWTNYVTIGLLFFLIMLGIVASFISKLTQNNSTPFQVLKSFSLYDNLSKILTIATPKQNQNLLFLNGMRVLSIFWIIFGHDNWFRFAFIKNWIESIQILTSPGIPTIVPAAYFAVDTFFWIGGFLVTIGMLQQVKKAKNFAIFYFGSVLHRFIRVWPTYMIAILIFWKIAPFMGNGPIWKTFYTISCSCNNGGVLWNMFFLDNFGDHGPGGMDYCFGWGWYLAVDFQLFLITPFIIYAYHKNKTVGWIVTLILFLASVICAFVMIYVNDWRYPIPNPTFPPQPKFMDQFYYKPYIRASAYFMGFFAGFIYLDWKNGQQKVVKVIERIKSNIIIRISFYAIGIFLCQFVIWIIVSFQTGEKHWSTVQQAFYNSLNRVLFLFGMYLCVFAAMFNCKNDPSKFILGHWIFSPLAKVSFCMYLTHFIVIMSGTLSGRIDLFWQPQSSIYMVISDIFWSILFATALSLLIQSPILNLQKIIFSSSKDKPRKLSQSIRIQEKQRLTEPLIIQISNENLQNNVKIKQIDL